MAGVFKAYDIRGIVPEEVDETLAYRIGQAFVSELVRESGAKGAPKIGIGYDARPSSPSLSAAFLRGAADGGAVVECYGLTTTPMTYWANWTHGLDGSAGVTASHNPHPYNGFKLSRRDCVPIGSGTGMEDIERTALASAAVPPTPLAPVVAKSILEPYIRWLTGQTRIARPLKIAVDAGNGMGGLDTPVFLDRLSSITWGGIYMEPDGTFPNHEANPLKESTLKDLQKMVIEGGYDLGVSFDGDGDRCAFVDERGRIVRSDALTALLAAEHLSAHPRRAIVYDLRLSRTVPETIVAAGGVPVRSRVGHAFMKAAMRKHNAVFGGEFSAHFYYGHAHFTDSGILTLIAVLNLLSAGDGKFSERLAPHLQYPKTPEINFRVSDARRALDSIRNEFADGQQDELDGVSAAYPQGWINVRSSNTEPLLRLNAEGDTQAILDALVARVHKALGPDAQVEKE